MDCRYREDRSLRDERLKKREGWKPGKTPGAVCHRASTIREVVDP